MPPPCSDPPEDRATHPLCAVFEIALGDVDTCPLRDEVAAVEEVRQENVDGGCHVDVTVSDGDGTRVVHVEDRVEPACPCPVFRDHGCIPNVREVTDEGFVVDVYIPDHETLRSCVDALRTRVANVELRRLRMDPRSGDENSVIFHLQELTEKQRQAAVRALAAGYYERPRKAGLGELSAELNISKSALSQRLTAVEAKLAKAAFGSECG